MEIKILDKTHSVQVQKLRMHSYAFGKGFMTKPKSLVWSNADSSSVILGAFDEDELTSTMRIEIVNSPVLASQKIEMDLSSFPLRFPAMILSRAATHKKWLGKGLNAALRYEAIRLAEKYKIKDLLGTFIKGSPREKTLRDMGYTFYTNKEGWTSPNYLSLQPVTVVHLDLEQNGALAKKILKEKMGHSIKHLAIDNQDVSIPIVDSL